MPTSNQLYIDKKGAFMISNYTNKVKEIISSHKAGLVFTHVDFNSLGSMSRAELKEAVFRFRKKITKSNLKRRGLFHSIDKDDSFWKTLE